MQISVTISDDSYDAWIDINDDGVVDAHDLHAFASGYGASGEPFDAKAGIEYDSGWTDITDKQGQQFEIIHGLSTWGVMVDIVGTQNLLGGSPDGVHQRNIGMLNYVPGWSRAWGGESTDIATWVIQTSDGGYAVTGYVWRHTLDYDFRLVKTDTIGIEEWILTYGGPGDDHAECVIQTSDGGYALAGYTKSFGAGKYDFYLVKIGAYGSVQWNKTYGGAGDDYGLQVVETSDGGYAIAGEADPPGPGSFDMWLVKTDSSGNQQWNRTFGGPNQDDGRSIVQTSDGGYLLAGYTRSFGAGGFDCWMVKTNSTGHMKWNQTYGASGNDLGESLIQTSDGGYALAGRTESFGAGGYDFYVIKTNSTGHEEWSETYGGTSDDIAWCVIQTADGGYALAGYTKSFGAGKYDFYLVKTDASGGMQWNQTYGGVGEDRARSVVQTSDCGYALAGDTESFGTGGYDFWVLRTESESGIVWVDSTLDSILLYRGRYDSDWQYIRVRIWKVKEDS